MNKHFLFLLLILTTIQASGAGKHICTRGSWDIVEEPVNNEWNPGWVLQARKSGQSTDLHFHSHSLQKLWESAHFLILKDSGIAHSSSSLLVVHMPDTSRPVILYQFTEPTLNAEYEIELLEASEKDNELKLKIRVFDERNGKNQYIILHRIAPAD